MNKERLVKFLKQNKKILAVICIVLLPLSVIIMVVVGVSALLYSAISTIYNELLTDIDKL